jgi:hypothetical protein
VSDLSYLKTAYLSASAAAQAALDQVTPLQEELDRQLTEIQRQFDEEHGALIDEQKRLWQEAETAERRLREAVLAEYRRRRASGDDSKQLGDGLSVRVTCKYKYEEGAALAWADSNAPFIVKRTIDAKQFESIVKNLQASGLNDRVPFVEVVETATAVIKL